MIGIIVGGIICGIYLEWWRGWDEEVAWIELHQAVWTHRKSLIMAAELGLTPADAVKHMAQLWCWALDNAPSGSLVGLPAIVIAIGAGWMGEADRFVEAAKSAGFIDRDPPALHDWDDYAGRLIERRTAERERSRQRRAANRKPPKIPKPTAGRPLDGQQTTVGTVPNPTVPNLTQPKDQDPSSPNAGKEYSEDFERFWKAYPKDRRKAKAKAYIEWRKLGKGRPPVEKLIEALEQQKTWPSWKKEDGKYIPWPERWLKNKRWEDEPDGAINSAPRQQDDTSELRALARGDKA